MMIKPAAFAALVTLALAHPAQAASCVNGVYRAGCVGPNGAAVVRKGPVYHAPVIATVARSTVPTASTAPAALGRMVELPSSADRTEA